MNKIIKKNFFFLIFFLFFSNSKSEIKNLGDLTKQIPIEKTILMKGENGKIHYFEPNSLTLYTGNLYVLRIQNVSDSKHYFTSTYFSKSIFTRKIQIKNRKQKLFEIKGNISEVEIFPGQSLEWWFVPVKTGVFDDLHCSVKDKISNKRHKDMGMTGEIIIK